MKHEQLKSELKRLEGMYPNAVPLVTALQLSRLAIIDLETEIKDLKSEEQV